MNNNLNVLPSTIAKIVIDFVLYCDWVSDDNTTTNCRSSLIDNALNLSMAQLLDSCNRISSGSPL
ncbi:hypothetical protein DFA_06522 [Cavenderia fasciculata]|uniref:Uncharacterized protein n=1 Tax=Cavenderia fasciculata TaxID=261658 RepID=F4PJ86_CACFS|nr:uncharacterized protein DFA_06522 [Cavenderia fasciculata]EGG24372.1 hypothetical protein DFA_06522 [Cavenderia fasciculata]|eukprot:XP_004362223.1 hypothetical protein DFA_06522 [Cavenderia fasciculata]